MCFWLVSSGRLCRQALHDENVPHDRIQEGTTGAKPGRQDIPETEGLEQSQDRDGRSFLLLKTVRFQLKICGRVELSIQGTK